MVPTLVLVSVMVFAVMRLVPGDVVALMFADLGYAKSLAEMRARLGLDQPFLEQYVRWTMYVGVAATALAVALAAAMGIAGGFWSGWLDMGLGRVVDAWMAFPGLVMAIVLLALLGPGLWSVILALGISQAFPNSRTIRGATLVVREQPYIEASLAAGASKLRVLMRHVLPNVVAPIIIVASNLLGMVILIEAAVSFLGYGVPPPQPSWGGMLSATGRSYMTRAPWLSIFPGLALSIAVFAFNILGDALRDLLDPRLRGQ
jgi:peptide/nickel transport system permease protein